MLQKGRSLHIGLNHVDTDAYEAQGYTVPELSGCINDARDMQQLAADQGFVTLGLTDDQATTSEVMRQLSSFARELQAGDIFLLTYSGHGGQVDDVNGDESDGKDETWVLYDRMLIDDELFQMFNQFAAGVRIFMLSDSCHSGTVARIVFYKAIAEQYRQMSMAKRDLSTPSQRELITAASERTSARYPGNHSRRRQCCQPAIPRADYRPFRCALYQEQRDV